MTNATPWTSRARQRDRRAASRRRPWPSHAPFSRRPPDAPARTAGLAASRPGARRKAWLAHAPAAANLLQPCCIQADRCQGRGQRDQQARPADRGQLGHGRGAGPGDRRAAPWRCAPACRGRRARYARRSWRWHKPREAPPDPPRGLLHHREPSAHVGGQALQRRRQASEKKRAPWLPPKTQQQAGRGVRRRVRHVAKLQHGVAHRDAGQRAFACASGASSLVGMKESPMRSTKRASRRLARPITAFCSWIAVGMRSVLAAMIGGSVG